MRNFLFAIGRSTRLPVFFICIVTISYTVILIFCSMNREGLRFLDVSECTFLPSVICANFGCDSNLSDFFWNRPGIIIEQSAQSCENSWLSTYLISAKIVLAPLIVSTVYSTTTLIRTTNLSTYDEWYSLVPERFSYLGVYVEVSTTSLTSSTNWTMT